MPNPATPVQYLCGLSGLGNITCRFYPVPLVAGATPGDSITLQELADVNSAGMAVYQATTSQNLAGLYWAVLTGGMVDGGFVELAASTSICLIQAGAYDWDTNNKASTLLTRIPSTITISGGKVAATIASGDDVDTATLLTRLTAARAGYLDNLNVGGNVASHADVDPATLIAAVGQALAAQGLTSQLLTSLQIMVGGPGPILIDHNYGGSNNLQFTDLNGAGIEGAVIQAYRASDYNAGRRTAVYVVGQTMTDINGDWLLPLALPSGSYILAVTKVGTIGSSGSYGPYFTPLAVT